MPKEVCDLRCSRSLLWWCVSNLDFDCIVDTSGFWGLDVPLGVRVNQYKLFVCFYLALNSLNYDFKLFLTLLIKTIG